LIANWFHQNILATKHIKNKPSANGFVITDYQARNQGGAKPALENFSPTLEKCVGHSLKILDMVQKILALVGKLFAPPGVPSWLRAC